MLTSQLRDDLTSAMRSHNRAAVGALRLVLTAIKEAEVAGTSAEVLDDDATLAVIRREVKRKDEAIEAFTNAGRTERAAAERAERDVLAAYLPAMLEGDELAQVVADALAAAGLDNPSQMGPAMKVANAAVAGRADGRAVAGIVKGLLAL